MNEPTRFRIGNQTAFAAGSALEPFGFALEHGFSSFEFFPDHGPSGQGGWEEKEMVAGERESIRRMAAAKELTLTVHAPLAYNPVRDHVDPRLHGIIEFAHDIGAKLLNLHLDPSRGAEVFAELLHPAILLTAEARIQLALENTVFTSPDDFNRFFEVLEQTGKHPIDHVGMCFDMGHANACQATLNDYCGFLDRLGPHVPVIHLHLHENYGDRDSHLTLFTGPSRESVAGLDGMLDRLASRAFSGCAIMEQWPDPPSLLVEARDRLRQLASPHFK